MPSLLLVVAAALVDPRNHVLIAQRPAGKAMAGLWEFPGGKVDPGETPESALVRELHEELGIIVREVALVPLTFVSHRYDAFHLLMPLYLCRAWDGTPAPVEVADIAFVPPDALPAYPMPEADLPLIKSLQAALAR